VIQSKPIIVRIIKPPEDRNGLIQLAHTIYSVVGLVGVIILVAIVVGVAIGGVMFWIRRRQREA
jgi:hypothetical protein